jgi:lipopolysaccharide transport system ATP-binding protein
MLGINYSTDTLRKSEFWALKDINFELKRGETLGLIGVNGSGKSTFLRMLTGIFPPDKGRITINGSIGSLIAVGAGFHPHMSGRENIYLNGTILGMSNSDIKQKFDEIVDFSEIEDFLDAPVSTYSSGMRVRLGFAIAVHREPDILLVDEVLSVGDLGFRNKSLRKMSEYKEKANAIIFVSHDLEQVRVLCDKTVILNKGELDFRSITHEACVRYEEITRKQRIKSLGIELQKKNRYRYSASSKEDIHFIAIGIIDCDGNNTSEVSLNQTIRLYCDFKILRMVQCLYFSIGIINDKHQNCIWLMSNDAGKAKFDKLECSKYRLLLIIKEHHLVPGIYYLNVGIRNSITGETYERHFTNTSFRVLADETTLERGIINVEKEWKLKKIE